jgi:3-hydroxybutyryl-CoA dehydrogenase
VEIKRVTVLGGGTMGNGIAQVAAMTGYQVALYDIKTEFLDRATATIDKSLARLTKKEAISAAEAEAIKQRIRTSLDLKDACQGTDIVIEAIPEILDLKKKVFAQIDEYSPGPALLATNTSQLSVTEIAAATKRPEKVIGMHWFNPPPLMKLIEIVTGVQTSEETLEITKDISVKMGKRPVVCKDAQGFITTRALTAFLVECYRIYEEGLATAEDIDEAIRLGLNHPMGPLQLSDFVGLDVLEHICKDLVAAYGDRFIMPQSVSTMVRAGWHGAKTGRGFYVHQKKKK